MKDLSAFKLCYVDKDIAYFTTCPLDKQWGDDWNDAPYEHNAGTPYEWREYMRERGTEPYEIKKLMIYSGLQTPADRAKDHSSWLSVQQINAEGIPWLQSEDWESVRVRILPGFSIPEFILTIHQVQGWVFIPLEDVENYKSE